MKNALIVNGGLNTTKRDQLDNYDLIVAVDSGTEQAYKLFLKPDLIIGDLDSIDEKTIKRAEKDEVQILKYETNKNETDFELALKHVLDEEIKDITISRTLSIIVNPKRYYASSITTFKREILDMFLVSSSLDNKLNLLWPEDEEN